jgi:hypothetical protein
VGWSTAAGKADRQHLGIENLVLSVLDGSLIPIAVVQPANTDQAEAECKERGDAQQTLQSRCIHQEDLARNTEHQHQRSKAPIAQALADAPKQEGDGQQNGKRCVQATAFQGMSSPTALAG